MTAECRLAERVFDFADDSLRPTPAIVARARGHLVVCAPCAERFGADARFSAALAAPPPAPPPRFVLRRRRALWPLAVAAVLALATTAALVADFGRREIAPAAPPPFALPPGTTFTLTVSTITIDRGRRSVVEETTRYAAGAPATRREKEAR